LFAYALLGGIAGFCAAAFVWSLLALRGFVKQRAGLPAWARPAIGGVTMSVIGLILPATLGIGYSTLSQALLGQLSWRSMTTLGVGKIAATVTSYGWGLSGGIFSPTLFMGAMLGGTVAHLVHPFAGPTSEIVGSFALVGMGAFFAGAIRAPITSILIIFELTGDYAIILPLMISNMISYSVASWLQPVPIYDALLRQDGVPMPAHAARHDLRTMTVEQAMRPGETPIEGDAAVLFPDQSLDFALLELGRHATREASVVERASPGKVVGLLSLEDISATLNRT
jgi:CIC family chloride channel protein